MESILFILLVTFFQSPSTTENSDLFYTDHGVISFRSDAPQEIISARSDKLQGIIDPEKKTFVFKVNIRSFEGFNSGLQHEHFNEKYLESDKYPFAIFSGKIIEDADFRKEGSYLVRAKGKMNIHGIEQERIIKGILQNKAGVYTIDCRFIILLNEHNIKIPRVVHEKIASEIKVEITAELRKKSPHND